MTNKLLARNMKTLVVTSFSKKIFLWCTIFYTKPHKRVKTLLFIFVKIKTGNKPLTHYYVCLCIYTSISMSSQDRYVLIMNSNTNKMTI